MVGKQIRHRGVRDEEVLEAMMRVPREKFLPENLLSSAYEDRALPVGQGQTISQPFIVAYMTEQLALTPSCRVPEIGTGTGYQTAVLAVLCAHVYTVERITKLRDQAEAVHARLGINNVTYSTGDGSRGLRDFAPYDRILVTAAAPRVPTMLVEQMVDGGRLVIPVGGANEQTIVTVVRDGHRTIETPRLACRFVKLIGEQGWAPESV